MRLVQLLDKEVKRHVALVEGEHLRLLTGFDSVYRIALLALEQERTIRQVVSEASSGETLDYDAVYSGQPDWKILPCFDHPDEPARCLVTGTGLTHRKSAQSRDAMHGGAEVTDSMRMYQLGEEGGRPQSGQIGAAPEWFYKGTGFLLKGHGEALEAPAFGEDGGEEPEIAGVYLIDRSGRPRRVGMAQGNEFSDHVMERRNYLYLAPSKLRQCAIGPELVIEPSFEDVRGRARIEREGVEIWAAELATGEAHMCHSLANMEHHHFKYPQHRQEGDAHIHFYGAGAFSFTSEIRVQAGDVMEVAFEGFGRPLRNPLSVAEGDEQFVGVEAL